MECMISPPIVILVRTLLFKRIEVVVHKTIPESRVPARGQQVSYRMTIGGDKYRMYSAPLSSL
jgi:hypothetical protein